MNKNKIKNKEFKMQLRLRHPHKIQLCWIIPIACLLVFTGCADRQLIRTTPQMDTKEDFWIRVLLLDDATNCKLKVKSSFTIFDGQSRQTRLSKHATPTDIRLSGGKIYVAARAFDAKQITILPDEPYVFFLNKNPYRGKLIIIQNPDGKTFDVINKVPIEPYLAGVVGAEMPDYWRPQALKAQAIAARTYCLYIKRKFGQNRHWDVSKTQANQVYIGVSAESKKIWAAVESTTGQVLICKQPDGSKNIFPTYYSSTCAGHTENSKNVFGDSFETLASVPCPYCKYVAKAKHLYWSDIEIDKKKATEKLHQRYPKLKKLGPITKITVAKQNDYKTLSRMTLVKLTNSAGKSDFIRAEDLRLTLDPAGKKIKSTSCEIINMDDTFIFTNGKGWGHAVGLCQCGAQGMAKADRTAREILYYYYLGSEITKLY